MIYKIKNWLVKHIILQVFICSISFPILVYNGLPISLASLLSTLFFTPLLALHLCVSSLVFFLELCSLPNEWAIYILELITKVWHSTLNFSSHTWLFGFSLPPLLVLLVIPLKAFAIAHLKTPFRYVALCSSLFFIATYSAMHVFIKKDCVTQIPCNKGTVSLIDNNEVIIIDPGYIAQRPSAQSWARFTLAPEIIKHTGKIAIDHFIALQISARLFDTLLQLNTEMPIKHLYIPWWNEKLPPNAWFAYVKLRDTLKAQGSHIVSIKNNPRCVSSCITLSPLEKTLQYRACTYRSLVVQGQIDKTSITIYAAKNKKDASKKE